MAVLLVRHAIAVARHRWHGGDHGRPLTGRGRAQADALVGQLGPLGPTDVASSPWTRCLGTVAPLAAAAGLEVRPADALAEGNGDAAAELVEALLRAPGTAVVCTHGDVIPEVLAVLGVGGGSRCEKASTWVLDAGGGRVRGRYIPPPVVAEPPGVEVRAAGGLVWRPGAGGGREVLVVHRPAYDDWTLPKGKAEAGETDEACALREVEEETGLRCELGRYVGHVSYVDHRGRSKLVRYWEMGPLEGTAVPQHEVDEVRWLAVDGAERLLSYERDVSVLAAFASRCGG